MQINKRKLIENLDIRDFRETDPGQVYSFLLDERFEVSIEKSGSRIYVAAYSINETSTRSLIKDKIRCLGLDDALKTATFHINSLMMQHNISL